MHALGYGFQPFDMYDFNSQDILQAPTAPPPPPSEATRAAAATSASPLDATDTAGADAAAGVADADTSGTPAARSDPDRTIAPVVCVLSNILCYCSDDATADFLARCTLTIISTKECIPSAFLSISCRVDKSFHVYVLSICVCECSMSMHFLRCIKRFIAFHYFRAAQW